MLNGVSLKSKLTLIVILSILLTAIPASLLVAHYTKKDILEHETASLISITDSQIQAMQSRLNQSFLKLTGLARSIKKSLSYPINPSEIDGFYQSMSLNQDGIWRNKKPDFNGLYESGVYLPQSAELTDKQKVFHMRIKDVMDHFGAAVTGLHENVWFLSLHRSEVIFDTTYPDFVYTQQADNDYTQTPWVLDASPAANPDRVVTYTAPLFDPVPKKWMVSAVYPLYVNDQWVGALGQDLQLTNVLGALLEQSQVYPDTQHFLVNAQGDIVLAGNWQHSLEASATSTLDLSGHSQLNALLHQDISNLKPTLLADSIKLEGQDYIAIGMKIEPINWRYFKLIPKESIVKSANALWLSTVLFILVISTISGLFISGAVNRNVISRITRLAHVIQRYHSGDMTKAADAIQGHDEIALTAQAFDEMAERNQRTQKALAESQQRWSFALEGAGDGVWDWHIPSGKNLFSKQWKGMIGYQEDELEEDFKTFQQLVHPDDKSIVDKALTDYFNNYVDSYAAEFRMRCKDGSWKWILSRGMITERDQQGQPVRLIGTHTDISSLKQTQTELATSNNRLRSMLQDSPIAVRLAKNHGTEIILANQSYAELINKSEPQDVLGMHPRDNYHSKEEYDEMVRRVEAGQPVDNKLIHLSIAGVGARWVLASYSAIEFESEQCVIGWFYDVTEQLQIEEAMRLHASVFDNAWEGIIISDANNKIISVNKAFTEITGYQQKDLLGMDPRVLSSGRQDEQFYQDMWATMESSGHWRGEVWNRRKNGDIYAEILTLSAVKNEQGKVTHYVGVFADITEMKNTERMLENMAHYDALTKLPNRTLLSDRLEQALTRAERANNILAVCFIDLDGFKPINDSLGHDAGDELLVEIASRLEVSIRSGDTVARLGGDEFVVLITQAAKVEDLDPILSRLIDTVSEEIEIKEQWVSVTASIGVAVYPADNVDAEMLLRHADLAMYEAKQAGRNGYHIFDASLDKLMHERHRHIERLTHALKDEEFTLVYQPKVNLVSGKVLGVEALIRWQHPERGLLGPLEFLPHIESSDLIVEVGDWVLNEALRQAEIWQHAGLNLKVSINIAARQIQDKHFVDKLKNTLALYPTVKPEMLELEILETSALETYQTAQVIKDTQQKLGVSFALDDFGTGYSSLAYLKQLSAKTLKIDQTFVRDMLEDREDQAIVAGIIELAKVFNKEVIAEGVETDEHCIKLLDMGCVQAQGYGIAKPLAADTIPAWVDEYHLNSSKNSALWLYFNHDKDTV